jgi:hypothetical protein
MKGRCNSGEIESPYVSNNVFETSRHGTRSAGAVATVVLGLIFSKTLEDLPIGEASRLHLEDLFLLAFPETMFACYSHTFMM